MIGDGVRVEGFEAVKRDLAALDPALRKEIRKLEKSAAVIVADEARDIVPVRHGDLRAAIKAGATSGSGGYVKASLIYAPPIHWGWAAHNIEPQPFMYDALDNRREAVLDAYNEGVAAIVETTVRSGVNQ